MIDIPTESLAVERHSAGSWVEGLFVKGAQSIFKSPFFFTNGDELKKIDINALSPMEALNKLYQWQRKFADSPDKE